MQAKELTPEAQAVNGQETLSGWHITDITFTLDTREPDLFSNPVHRKYKRKTKVEFGKKCTTCNTSCQIHTCHNTCTDRVYFQQLEYTRQVWSQSPASTGHHWTGPMLATRRNTSPCTSTTTLWFRRTVSTVWTSLYGTSTSRHSTLSLMMDSMQVQ